MPLINFSGIASGIDTEGLIAATSEATRQTRVKPLQDKVTELTDTNDSLTQLKTKLTTLKSALQDMASINGGALAKQVTSSSETLITAIAENGATNGTYTVTLGTGAKAQNGVQALFDNGGDDWTSVDSLVTAGATLTAPPDNEVTITVGGEPITIEVTNTMTLGELAAAFNSESTKGVMSAVNVGSTASPVYRLMVTALSTGATDGGVSISAGSDFTGFISTTSAQSGTDATFDVDGVATGIQRPTNTVADVVPGVNFTILSNPGSSTPVTLTVTDDVSTTTSKVQDFVDAWNDIVEFIKEKNEVTRQESDTDVTNIFGALAHTSIDEDSLTALREALSGSVVSNGTKIRIFADIGVTTQQDGTLKLNTDTLATAIAEEPGSVNTLLETFANNTSLTGGTIDRYIGFNRSFDITSNNNRDQISDLNRRIADMESNISKTEASLRARYAILEQTMGRLQSQQSQLTSALAGLN